jgi:hypothetical protein
MRKIGKKCGGAEGEPTRLSWVTNRPRKLKQQDVAECGALTFLREVPCIRKTLLVLRGPRSPRRGRHVIPGSMTPIFSSTTFSGSQVKIWLQGGSDGTVQVSSEARLPGRPPSAGESTSLRTGHWHTRTQVDIMFCQVVSGVRNSSSELAELNLKCPRSGAALSLRLASRRGGAAEAAAAAARPAAATVSE